MQLLRHHSIVLLKTLARLVVSPHFLILTTVGNLLVFIFSELFYHAEMAQNPLVDERMDAIWWAFTTVTTVGFGDIVPATFWGRIIGITLMLMGTAIFACYIALISDAFMTMELKHLGSNTDRPEGKNLGEPHP